MTAVPRSVFISHSSRDAALARDLVVALEAAGVACWISGRDVAPGANYQEAIVAAIRGGRAMVVLVSEAANASDEVKKELSLASAAGVAVYPVRLGGVVPNSALSYELATRQWIDGGDVPVLAARLAASILGRGFQPQAADVPVALALPDKPSVAVLPFANVGGDPEQDYFADGMTDEIITALSRFRELFVIARNTSFTYKGRAVDIKQVGRDLGVRYILEGSVRRGGNRLRITAQLIDAATGSNLWTDRFEGPLDDIFDLQDQVTASVVGAITPALQKAERERAHRKPTNSLDAYDEQLLGMARFLTMRSVEDSDAALDLFRQAIARDSGFATAHALAAQTLLYRKASGWWVDPPAEIALGLSLARRAVELGHDDATALGIGGFVLAHFGRDVDAGLVFVRRAMALNPNHHDVLRISSWMSIWDGHPEEAVGLLTRAMRLSPLDPNMFRMLGAMAHAHFFTGRFAEAMSFAAEALRENPDRHDDLRIMAASCAMCGQDDKARAAIARLRARDPALRVSTLRAIQGPYRHVADHERYEEALRRAGLPEE